MKLPALEFEVFQHICAAGSTTAPEIHSKISEKRDTAYSTIKTAFDRLESKGVIYRKSRVGRTSIYEAKMSVESIQTSLLREFVSRVFPADKTPLFNTLIRDSSMTDEEIRYLERLLADKRK